MNPLDKLRLVMGWVILAGWLASIVLDIFLPSYEAPATIHLLMMLVAGALFGPSILRRNGAARDG